MKFKENWNWNLCEWFEHLKTHGTQRYYFINKHVIDSFNSFMWVKSVWPALPVSYACEIIPLDWLTDPDE